MEQKRDNSTSRGSEVQQTSSMMDEDAIKETKLHYRCKVIVMFFADILSVIVSYYFALWMRFDMHFSSIPLEYMRNVTKTLPFLVATTVVVYVLFHLYNSIWRYASITEAFRIVSAYLVIGILTLVERGIFFRIGWNIPRSVSFIAFIMSLFFCALFRFGYRMVRYLAQRRNSVHGDEEQKKNVMIVGAGQAARELINDLRLGRHTDYNVRVFVDDNPTKKGRFLEGIRIEGNRYDIPELVRKYDIDLIVFAIPSARNEDRVNILNICKDTGCQMKIIPGLFQIVNGEVNVSKLRDVQIEDLLGREEVKINLDEIKASIEGKIIMVTGGGGSIGSELCRQIASANPKQLIIFDIYEK